MAERIPLVHVTKADQWLLLSQKHVRVIFQLLSYLHSADSKNAVYSILTSRDIQRSSIWSIFTGVRASDEMFFPSLLSMLNLLVDGEEIERRRVTYADWEGMAHSPRTYGQPFVSEHARGAISESCIFMRKCQIISNNEDDSGESYRNWHRVVYGGDPAKRLVALKRVRAEEETEEENDEQKAKKVIVKSIDDATTAK